MVGHRDRAQAPGARGREQHLDGGGAVVGVVGVHVQVHVDQRTRRPAGVSAPDRRPIVTARREPAGRSPRAPRPRRHRRARGDTRRRSGGPSARPWRAGSRCGRPDARRSSRRSGAPRASRAAARRRSETSRRSARASGAAPRWTCSARTARGRARSPAGPCSAVPRSCAPRRSAAPACAGWRSPDPTPAPKIQHLPDRNHPGRAAIRLLEQRSGAPPLRAAAQRAARGSHALL